MCDAEKKGQGKYCLQLGCNARKCVKGNQYKIRKHDGNREKEQGMKSGNQWRLLWTVLQRHWQ